MENFELILQATETAAVLTMLALFITGAIQSTKIVDQRIQELENTSLLVAKEFADEVKTGMEKAITQGIVEGIKASQELNK